MVILVVFHSKAPGKATGRITIRLAQGGPVAHEVLPLVPPLLVLVTPKVVPPGGLRPREGQRGGSWPCRGPSFRFPQVNVNAKGCGGQANRSGTRFRGG